MLGYDDTPELDLADEPGPTLHNAEFEALVNSVVTEMTAEVLESAPLETLIHRLCARIREANDLQ